MLHFRRGLITRNIKEAVDIFHQRFGVSSIFLTALSANFNYNLQLNLIFLIRLSANYSYNLQPSVMFLIFGLAAGFFLIMFGIGVNFELLIRSPM